MATYSYPGVYVEEVQKGTRPIEGAGTSIGALMGIAERGPIGVPILVTSFDDFKRVYGSHLQGEALAYAVEGFFKNGGTQCQVLRLGHYTDITDADSVAASVASKTFNGPGGSTFASKTGSQVITTIEVAHGDQLDIDVNNLGVESATITALAAIAESTNMAAADFSANLALEIVINGESVTKTLLAANLDNTNANTKATTGAAEINRLFPHIFAVNNGDEIRITTDQKGSGASLSFPASAGQTECAFASVQTTETSDMADASAMTFAELKTWIEANIQTAAPGDLVVLTQNGAGNLVLTVTAGVAGPTSELDFKNTSTAALLATLGFSVEVVAGATTAAVAALIIHAGYRGHKSPGLDGNNYDVKIDHNPKHPSLGAGNDLAAQASSSSSQLSLTTSVGLVPGSEIEITDGVNKEFFRVTSITVTPTGSGVTHVIGLNSTLSNTYAIGNTTVRSLEFDVTVLDEDENILETWKQMSMNPVLDNYVETQMNDTELGSQYVFVEDQEAGLGTGFPSAIAAQSLSGGSSETAAFAATDILGDETAKTGIFAFDGIEVNLVACPPSFGAKTTIPATAPVHTSMLAYAEGRGDCFAILDGDEGHTKTSIKTYRENTLGVDNKWGALYWPFIEVVDGAKAGVLPKSFVPPSGHIMGLYARVTSIAPPEGGISRTPAGEGDFGKLKGASNVEVGLTDSDQGPLNLTGVNCIRLFGKEVTVWGGRTLSTDPRWRYINQRRTMTFVQQSILRGTRWSVFANNDFRTWDKLSNQIKAFLSGMLRNGQLKGASADEAFFVRINSETTTPADVDAGRLNGEIGLALHKPAEFVIFKFSQLQGVAEVTE